MIMSSGLGRDALTIAGASVPVFGIFLRCVYREREIDARTTGGLNCGAPARLRFLYGNLGARWSMVN